MQKILITKADKIILKNVLKQLYVCQKIYLRFSKSKMSNFLGLTQK